MMPRTGLCARRLYDRARRLAHPLVDRWLPVTYLPDEVIERKRRLDPSHLRQRSEPNADTDRRVVEMAGVVGVPPAQARRFLDEARNIQPNAVDTPSERGLGAPMCYEDRYTLYVVTRALSPSWAVETGVGYGASSLYVLSAMEAAGHGRLTSIELLDDPRVGRWVPADLGARWPLLIGDSVDVLPRRFANAPCIDLFVHDSVHSHAHMWREFRLAWMRLRRGGVLLSHDILESNAFPRFVRCHRDEIDTWSMGVNCGLIRKR